MHMCPEHIITITENTPLLHTSTPCSNLLNKKAANLGVANETENAAAVTCESSRITGNVSAHTSKDQLQSISEGSSSSKSPFYD